MMLETNADMRVVKPESRNIAALTGLRFFASFAVVLWHSQGFFGISAGIFSPFQFNAAVQLFFVLSGFVLTIGGNDRKKYPDFMVGRVARIWPTHFAAFLFLFLIVYPNSFDYWSVHGRYLEWLNLLLLQAWVPNVATYFSFNGVAWSISVEMFCYLLFPLCVIALARNAATKALLFFLATGIAVFSISLAFPSVDPIWLGYINPATNLSVFVIGVAAGIMSRRIPAKAEHSSFSYSSVVEISAVIAVILANAAFGILHISWFPAGFSEFINLCGGAPVYALLMYVLARYRGIVSRILSWRPIVLLGEASFALYLFHQLIIKWYAEYMKAFSNYSMHLQFAAFLILSIVISIAAHFFVERPARYLILSGWKKLRENEIFG